MSDTGQAGAYGMRIAGLPGAHPWMQPLPPAAPSLRLDVQVGRCDDRPSTVDAQSADISLLGGGRLRARRDAGTIEYVLPVRPPDEDLLHPYLAPAAALVWRWAGREAIHAGAFAGGAGAVLVLAPKEGGKSTTLAWMAAAGVTVLSDDLAVVDGDRVLAGPRTIDLRAPGDGRSVRGGDRRRVTLPPAPEALPLAGVAVLEWGSTLEVEAVPVKRRMHYLAPQRSFPGLDANAVALLHLMAVPMVRLTRPPGPASLEEVGGRLLETFG